ncbi:MAG: ankyrin repeat domain-containing protein, partial [Bryobacteraceae bacterium]
MGESPEGLRVAYNVAMLKSLIAGCSILFLLAVHSTHGADDTAERYYQAIRNNDLATLRSLVKTVDVNAKDRRGSTPLMYAASIGSPEATKLLLDSGADVRVKNAFDATALLWAGGDASKVKMLLAAGADVNAKSKMGRTPLLVAAYEAGASEAVKALLDAGADVTVADSDGVSVLLNAAQTDDIGIIRLLLAKNAPVPAKHKFLKTALSPVAGLGNIEATKLMLAAGADVNASGDATPSSVKNGPIALGSFTPLLFAAAYGGVDTVRLLLDAGANVNAQDVRGMTPLMLAIATDRPDPGTVKLLLARGADTKLKSKSGETALDWARKFRDPRILAALGERTEKTRAATVIPASVKAPANAADAVEKSIRLMQTANDSFLKTGGCGACHSHNVSGLAVEAAKAAGIKVDEKVRAGQTMAGKGFFLGFEQPLLQRVDPPGGGDM